MAITQFPIYQVSNPADREKLFKVLQECSGAMTRINGEKDYISESITQICNDLKLPKKIVSRLVKVFHKQNYDEEIAVHEQFEQLYENIVK